MTGTSSPQRAARASSQQTPTSTAHASQRGAARPAAIQATPTTATATASAAAAAPEADPAEAPLDPATIQQLLATLRSLPRPVLEALSQGFRRQFTVPAAAVTIADRISQKQHHDWIEAFLVQHQLQPGRAAQPLS